MIHVVQPINVAWRQLLRDTLISGRTISPRGQLTYERDHVTVTVDPLRAVLTEPERKLSYRFLAAEAGWILRGQDDLATLLPYAKRMAEFSDDGVTLAGAYGPRIAAQLPYVLGKLTGDADTRQATLTTWVPSPTASRDVPCTVAIDFKIRDGRLRTHVFMRSSDLWLGLPYDLSSFAMLTCFVAGHLNRSYDHPVTPARLYLTAASSHLYDRDRDRALAVLRGPVGTEAAAVPMWVYSDPDALLARLDRVRDGDPSGRWWV